MLIKYCNRRGYLDHIRTLYGAHSDPSILQFIRDDGLRQDLSQYTSNVRKPQGKTQNWEDIHRHIEMLECSTVFNHWMSQQSDDRSTQMFEFISHIKAVLVTQSVNQKKTTEKRVAKQVDGNNKRKRNNKSVKDIVESQPNVLPPTYLGETSMDIYTKQNIPSYKLFGSQTAQQTIKKVHKAYLSFFSYPSSLPPQYQRSDKFNLVFQKNSFTIVHLKKNTQIRLAVGKQLKQQMKQEDPKNSGFLTYHIPSKVMKGKNVVEVELVPSQFATNHSYKLIVKYTVTIPKVSNVEDNLKKASIDLGVSNLATVFSPCFDRPIIYSGRRLVALNKQYNDQIDFLRSDLKRTWGKETSKRIQSCWINRANHINDFFNHISSDIIKRCISSGITELIIGYNKNWKSGVNLGRSNNRRFCDIPYRRFVNMLFYKGATSGVHVVENEESYTSKCDALSLEEVGRHNSYSGKRVKRGLFQSARGVLLNADVNGAINIMRKHISKAYGTLIGVLSDFIQSMPYSKLCNPLTLFRKLVPMTLTSWVSRKPNRDP